MMQTGAREQIIAVFKQALQEKPFDDISVIDIVRSCGINRNTFYYHFPNIIELLRTVVLEETDRMIAGLSGQAGIEECSDEIMSYLSEHRDVIMNIFRSGNRELLEQYLMILCGYVVERFSDRIEGWSEVPEEDRSVFISLYKYECFGLISDWLQSGMTCDIRTQFHSICRLRSDYITKNKSAV